MRRLKHGVGEVLLETGEMARTGNEDTIAVQAKPDLQIDKGRCSSSQLGQP